MLERQIGRQLTSTRLDIVPWFNQFKCQKIQYINQQIILIFFAKQNIGFPLTKQAFASAKKLLL